MAVLGRGQITITSLIDGKISYTHHAWADGVVNGIGTVGFSITVSLGKRYTGVYSDFTEQPSTDPSKYKWTETSNAIDQHFAWGWSPDGTDRFTRDKPGINLVKNTQFLNGMSGWGRNNASGALEIKNINSIIYGVASNSDTSARFSGFAQIIRLPSPISKGTKISVSFIDRNLSGETTIGCGIHYRVTGDTLAGQEWSQQTSIKDTDKTFSYTYSNTTDGVTSLNLMIVGKEKTAFSFGIRNVKLTIGNADYFFTTNPQDDYDNAVPRYIGRSLKDSTNPADFTWEPNPERKPWTSYASGLNGEGLSLMPYGKQLLLDTDVPSLTKVFADYNRYFSEASNSAITAIGFKKVDGLTNSGYVVEATSNGAGRTARDLVFYQSGDTANSVGFLLTVGKTYTLSCMARKISGDAPKIRFQYGSGNGEGYKGQYVTVDSTDKKQYSWTFVFSGTASSRFYVGGIAGDTAGTVQTWDFKLEPANPMNIPTPWTPAPSEDPLGAIPKYVGTAALPYEDWTKYEWNLNPAWLQQESNNNLANKVDNDTYNNDQSNVWQEISNRVTEEEAQAIQDSLTNVTNAYTDFVSTGGKHDQDLANLKSAINTDIQKLADKVLGYDFVNTWFRIGDGGLSIGEVNSNFEILVSNDQITFYDSGTAVAYVSNQSFFINSGMIVDDLQIGKFKFAKVNDNLMGLFHIA